MSWIKCQASSALIGGAAIIFLAACGNISTPTSVSTAAFTSTDITGVAFGRGFALTDHMGVVRSLVDFKGKVVVLFFGYTHCPDVCPTTMAELASAVKKLGKAAEDVQVLFVTLDPERDSPSALKQYLSGFNSQFLGLRGSDEATLELVSEFKAFSQKQAEAPSGDQRGQHTIEHSSGIYIFDPRGQLRLYAKSSGDGGDALARDLSELLKPAA